MGSLRSKAAIRRSAVEDRMTKHARHERLRQMAETELRTSTIYAGSSQEWWDIHRRVEDRIEEFKKMGK
jgi:hypothetical protein